MKNVKNYIEIILLVVLMACMYNGKCNLLGDMLNTNLGKVIMLAFIVAILNFFGKTAAILAACIFVFGLHVHRKEGFKEGAGLEIKIGNDAKDKEETKQKKLMKKQNKIMMKMMKMMKMIKKVLVYKLDPVLLLKKDIGRKRIRNHMMKKKDL